MKNQRPYSLGRRMYTIIGAIMALAFVLALAAIFSSQVQALSRARAWAVTGAALAAWLAVSALGSVLIYLLAGRVFRPVRKLSREVYSPGVSGVSGDEVQTLAGRVRGLREEMKRMSSDLERSRERLAHSEKMAVMGKLAADMAHSIRNPMTSIKMRLFSLERSARLTETQQEDFEVISEEMRRLDNILRNFLEFSRPPKLKKQPVNVSEVVDMTLQLLQNRLELSGVTVERPGPGFLPEVEADPELLKEVLINLVVNACEAMPEGGRLTIVEEEGVADQAGRVVMVSVSDTGPGIPQAIQGKVMDPFFSTKEEGTGLGLPIAQRIVEEHEGRLEMRSEEGKGTTFIITLPAREEQP